MLEPNVVKATCSVPRRGRGSNPSDLSDTLTNKYCPVYSIGLSLTLKASSPTCGRTEHSVCLIFNFLFNCLIYGTDRQGSVPL